MLDTLNRSLQGSESKDEDMARYIAACDAIRDAFDCVVPLVHHCGHDATRPRGHSSLGGAHDAMIAVAETQEAWSLYTADAQGGTKLVTKVGRPIFDISVARDMSRAAMMVVDYRADAWLSKVVTR